MSNRQRLIAALVSQHLKVLNSSGANVYFMEQGPAGSFTALGKAVVLTISKNEGAESTARSST
jgi:hypothetical protein